MLIGEVCGSAGHHCSDGNGEIVLVAWMRRLIINDSQYSDIPLKRGNVWMMDQGGGYEGKLSIIDVETKQFWQSDKVNTLYPRHIGRG